MIRSLIQRFGTKNIRVILQYNSGRFVRAVLQSFSSYPGTMRKVSDQSVTLQDFVTRIPVLNNFHVTTSAHEAANSLVC